MAQPRAPLPSPLLKCVMHAASSPHDLRCFRESKIRALFFPIFVMRNIQTIGAFVPPTTAMLYFPGYARVQMRRLQQSPPEAQRRCDVNGRLRFCPEASLQKMRRSNRANSRTLQAHHLKSMTKKTTLKELGEMLGHVVKYMATKDDIADLRREMATKDDINRLDTKMTKFEEREIDHALERIAAIEKHLGLDKKIAA
jgi:hypothetical protein